ncbi:MAG: hypothetical protein C5B51_14620 [Terriglobia bacterium]|nr:MAG: hypothetical protein C5B51_14620 [Terriglobia bacterium]
MLNVTRLVTWAALGAAFVLAPGPGYGQSAALTPFDKLPDWTGLWMMMGGTVFDTATQTGKGGAVTPGVREHPPYTEVYEKKYEEHLAKRDANRFPDVITNCGVPVGYPRILNLPDAYEFMVRPEEFYIITENGPNTMRVYTDGRPLPKKEDTWGTYTGVSVGHWEGDTLVWETTGLKGDRDNDSILDRTGLILSDAAHITTRMRKINDNTLQAVLTIEDSKALTKPWVVTKQFRKQKPGLFMYDYGCAENNRNPVDTSTGETLVLGSDGKPVR